MSDNSIPSIRFESFKKGRRFWCGKVEYDPVAYKTKWTFYSDHNWPFYHGEYLQSGYNRQEAYRKFMEWIP